MDNLYTGWVIDTSRMGGSSVLYIKPTGFDITKGEIMAMSRKDYELIARCVSNARYGKEGLAPEFQHGVDAVAMWLDIQLAAAYSNYDSQKFLSACQYGKLPRISEVA